MQPKKSFNINMLTKVNEKSDDLFLQPVEIY